MLPVERVLLELPPPYPDELLPLPLPYPEPPLPDDDPAGCEWRATRLELQAVVPWRDQSAKIIASIPTAIVLAGFE